MYDIISVGSATWDCFIHAKPEGYVKHGGHIDACYAIGQKVLIDKMESHSGGGGTNTAVAFSRLGFKTGYIGGIGTDHNGQAVRAELVKEKVDCIAKPIPGSTGYSVILLGLKHDRSILTHKGVNNQLPYTYKDAKAYYFTSMMHKSWGTAKKILRQVKKKQRFYAFNPSAYQVGKGVRYLQPFIKDCGLLIMNKEEAQSLLKKKCSMQSAAQELGKHALNVVITDGPRGAVGYDGELYTLKLRKVTVVETTGAGDAFGAGTMVGLLKRKSLPDAMQLGQREAASVLRHVGAKQDLLRK
ncbi:hypothetical protein CMO91_02490 [Candidatus Woesearchaeota archaeon]|nr:hypothetical protein [Candidatus Woesearchaeota archaeon]